MTPSNDQPEQDWLTLFLNNDLDNGCDNDDDNLHNNSDLNWSRMYLRIYNLTMFCIFSKLLSQRGELTLQKDLILKTHVYWKEWLL